MWLLKAVQQKILALVNFNKAILFDKSSKFDYVTDLENKSMYVFIQNRSNVRHIASLHGFKHVLMFANTISLTLQYTQKLQEILKN